MIKFVTVLLGVRGNEAIEVSFLFTSPNPASGLNSGKEISVSFLSSFLDWLLQDFFFHFMLMLLIRDA